VIRLRHLDHFHGVELFQLIEVAAPPIFVWACVAMIRVAVSAIDIAAHTELVVSADEIAVSVTAIVPLELLTDIAAQAFLTV
jgi:hypothetical protein